MPELELLRRIVGDPDPPSTDAYLRARAVLLERFAAAGGHTGRARRRWLLPIAGLAVAAGAAAAILLSLGTGVTETASAASVLRKAAEVARTQPVAAGEVLYVKSENAYLATATYDHASDFSVLVPHIREVWIGADGGRVHESSGQPVFLSQRDRERWIEHDRPELPGGGSSNTSIPARALDLPGDADALYARLRADAEGHGNYLEQEMFVLIGDALRETTATPAQRPARRRLPYSRRGAARRGARPSAQARRRGRDE